MSSKVTILTQTYNASKHMYKCIKSILNQTYSNIEYILIDDGSTDGTQDIIKEYSEKDSRIKYVFCKDNSKNVARWIEIFQDMKNVEKCGYFILLDSDDWLELDCVEKLVKIAEEGDYDIVATGSIFHYSETNAFCRAVGTNERQVINENNIVDYAFDNFTLMSFWWAKLYKMDLIMHTSLANLMKQSYAGPLYGIDVLFAYDQYSRSKKIYIDSSFLHNYRIDCSSTTYKSYEDQRIYHAEAIYDSMINFVSKFSVEDSEKMKLPYRLFVDAVGGFFWFVSYTDYSFSSEILRKLNIIFNLKHFQTIYDHSEYSFIAESRKQFVITFMKCVLDIGKINDEYKKILIYFAPDICELFNIDIKQFLNDYEYAYMLIKHEKYDDALEHMTKILLENGSNNEKFLNLYILTAANLERINEFIFGKVKLAEYHALKKEYSECQVILNELTDMGVEDNEEISELRKIVKESI